MVWFQCEACGENLKKPKLPNHFRICSAHKLSCIDCGDIFSKESVQSHTQCVTEAEKYGPKDHGKPSQNSNKPEKPKKNADVDITVGLSSRPPWFCSVCNTPATSKQTLLLHADGKKHRAKAKAFLAIQKQSNQTEETHDNDKENAVTSFKIEPVKATGSNVDEPKENDSSVVDAQLVPETKFEKKRKHGVGSILVTSNEGKSASDLNNGEVVMIQVKENEGKSRSKRNKNAEKLPNSECIISNQVDDVVPSTKKIKWKKLIISILKSKPDRAMKIKKLQKLVIKELEVSSITGDNLQLYDAMMEKINSSSRFIIDNKLVSLAAKTTKS